MKKTYTVSEEFVLEAHKAACSTWKEKIKAEFPEAFKESKLQVGKWYKTTSNPALFFVTGVDEDEGEGGDCRAYGINHLGTWSEETWGFADVDNEAGFNQEATNENIKEALIIEAKKRGLVSGIYIKSIWCNGKSPVKTLGEYKFNPFANELTIDSKNIEFTIFRDGVWAEPFEDIPTQEEIERVLNHLQTLNK